jgi:ribosome maturation factor RimP
MTAVSADDLHEPRLSAESGLAARVAQVIEPTDNGHGFRLVRVRLSGQAGFTLQVMAERPDGSFSIDDCEAVSRAISPVLDVADPIDRAYRLEVSSPGVDRPLVRASDFARWTGHEAKIEFSRPIEGRKRVRGLLAGLEGDAVAVEMRDAPAGVAARLVAPLDAVAEAKLVLNDALLAAAKARAHANPGPADGAEIDAETAGDVALRTDPRRTTNGRQR